MDKICFDKNSFNTYLFILLIVFVYLVYYIYHKEYNTENNKEHYKEYNKEYNKENDKDNIILGLKQQLYNIQLQKQKCQQDLLSLKTNNETLVTKLTSDRFLNKIYNPLSPPENIYPAGRLFSHGYDGYMQFQMLGYLNCPIGRYPVFGRYKYPGKTDKYEYYTIDDSRGRIKIPFKTKNYNELFDGDNINIDELGSCTFKKYENEEFRYNPMHF
jgi:hypothetical protein